MDFQGFWFTLFLTARTFFWKFETFLVFKMHSFSMIYDGNKLVSKPVSDISIDLDKR